MQIRYFNGIIVTLKKQKMETNDQNTRTPTEEEKVRKFIQEPEKGMKVKVYMNDSGTSYCFGLVIGIGVGRAREDKRILKREILILEESGTQYHLADLDYALPISHVRFMGQSLEDLMNIRFLQVLDTARGEEHA